MAAFRSWWPSGSFCFEKQTNRFLDMTLGNVCTEFQGSVISRYAGGGTQTNRQTYMHTNWRIFAHFCDRPELVFNFG